MANSDPYVYVKRFSIKAVIGSVTFNDVVSFSAKFALNDIPTASLVVAVGYDARSNGRTKATIHDNKSKLRPRDPVTVTLSWDSSFGNTGKSEEGTFVIFKGFLAGIGYQRSHNSANYTLELTHWLDDLSNSSALNGNWMPGAPYALATNASFFALTMAEGGAGSDEGSTVPAIDINGDVINKGNAEEDLWGKVIRPLFEKICTYPLPDDGENTAALEALKNIESPSKLPLDLGGLESTGIDLSLRAALTKEALDSFAYTSFWNKLVGEYASTFFFAVSPGVETAKVIPFFAGLKWSTARSKGGKEIKADEYSYASFNASMKQFLESVMVFWPQQNDPMLGTGGEVQSSDAFSFPVASYPDTGDKDKPGLRLFKEPPGWLANLSPWPIYSGATTGIKGKAPGDCMAPAKGETNPPPTWLPPADAATELKDSEICTRFAKHWYKTEVLSQRYGELSGKLRFDIAPGSTVKIEMPVQGRSSGGPLAPDPDGNMIGYVTEVTYSINAERAVAGTSFKLSFLRTEDEDDEGLFTDAQPPLYKASGAWGGGNLKG